MQLVIGFCALLSIPLFRLTQPLFSFLFIRLGYDSAGFLLIRFLVVFGFMLIPVTLMGMTLPVVVGASYKKVKSRYAYLAGKLYGINTLGAVFGTLAAGFLLIPALGILKTCVTTGARGSSHRMRSALANSVMKVTRKISVSSSPKGKSASVPRRLLNSPNPVLVPFARSFSWPAAVFLLSGVSALAYEIIWFRLLAQNHRSIGSRLFHNACHLPSGSLHWAA